MESCLYFDGKTAQGYPCNIDIAAECVYIYFLEDTKKLIIWNKLDIKDFDINGNNLIIKYGEYPHQTIECISENAYQFFEKLSQNNLSKQSKSFWLKNKVTIAITLCVAFVIIGLSSYFIFLPWVAEKAAVLIPQSAEIELGNAISESILHTSTEEDSATYYANQFVSNLKTTSAYSIQINVIESNDVNAFALPGGKIFVYSELIKKIDSYEEFAALLGHEISHVTYQHSLKSICRTAASSIFIASLFGDVTGISSGIIEQADAFKQLHYSRELETQADEKGLEFMMENKISPKGMLGLLTILKNESEEMPDYMKYISTHPETEERLKNINSKKESKLVFTENVQLKRAFEKMKSHLD